VTVVLDELTVADAPSAWRECGFEVEDDRCVVGGVRIRFAPEEGKNGLTGWSLSGVSSTELDGLETSRGGEFTHFSPHIGDKCVDPASEHPNGIAAIDHVVAISSDLDRTVAALRAAGLDLRRVREEPTPAGAPRQAFFRLGPTILEVVQEPAEATERHGGNRPAFFWGLAFVAPDLERTVAFLGEDRVSAIRDAVQPGRRIATLRRGAGLSVPVALMTPRDRESAKSVE
jgi:catechol 2,3-dioxygenase-like lactoylglutathione lyase family enzyme